MSAYILFIHEKTLDPAELATYSDEVGATLAGHDVKLLVRYGPHEDLEGPPTEGTVIVEFPNMEAARAWYHSPAYTEVRQHRIKGALFRSILVDGL